MKIKVHRIIDGIAEVEAASLEDAEKMIDGKLNAFIVKNEELTNDLGASSIQGKAYLPGSEES